MLVKYINRQLLEPRKKNLPLSSEHQLRRIDAGKNFLHGVCSDGEASEEHGAKFGAVANKFEALCSHTSQDEHITFMVQTGCYNAVHQHCEVTDEHCPYLSNAEQ